MDRLNPVDSAPAARASEGAFVLDAPTFAPDDELLDAPLPRHLQPVNPAALAPRVVAPVAPVRATQPEDPESLHDADWARLSLGLGIAGVMAAVLVVGLLAGF